MNDFNIPQVIDILESMDCNINLWLSSVITALPEHVLEWLTTTQSEGL